MEVSASSIEEIARTMVALSALHLPPSWRSPTLILFTMFTGSPVNQVLSVFPLLQMVAYSGGTRETSKLALLKNLSLLRTSR